MKQWKYLDEGVKITIIAKKNWKDSSP